ncbi:MltA-interacting protein MipA [Tatumella citrea]|uniref:MltA-interacting protein MipA n=1 Tax=Tatumella citrea TaxID=53336 RepID=A0A1Y0L894_TATCI|nr:MltA-interacting protein MipA [Tatumella citrea]ARU98197.1 MltA-interacting protein MipA [Tatumella citrea]
MLKKSLFCFSALVSACFSGQVLAENTPLTVGASVLYMQSPYHGDKDRYYPFPLLNYEGDHFFISGWQAGYYLWKDNSDQLSVIITSSGQEYRPKKNDFSDMRQLDKRHLTLMAGGMWRHTADWGVVKTSLVGDVLGESNGMIWTTDWHYPLTLGGFTLNPGVGLSWNSARETGYYYGVSQDESSRSGIASYHSGDSWNPYAEVSAVYPLTSRWQLGVGGRYQWFDNAVKDSPMVSKSGQVMVWSGVSYTF